MHLILIHGSYFGAWCWDALRPELVARGHRVTAVDLPISEIGVGASGYADAVIAASDWSEPPVLVAHSMSGLVAPVVARRRPVERIVFLAAFLPQAGMSANDQRHAEPIDPPTAPSTLEFTDLGDDLWMVGPNTARELFMHDAGEEVAAWAIERLRPQWYGVMSEVTPLEAWPSVPVDSIVCRDDRALNTDWARTAAQDRLGVEAIELEGGHSPMLTRPSELAAVLDRCVGAEHRARA
jgi:pimeloyl-ACP methyl ester carboxylesterase